MIVIRLVAIFFVIAALLLLGMYCYSGEKKYFLWFKKLAKYIFWFLLAAMSLYFLSRFLRG
ncbi:MAG TPA: hypothetical protein DCO68_06480 [Methylophilaceae bacterium]|nr:hypothetical protein [Methylophilaceae bacterium]HAJ71708.1 hypothetical protein [Methylophilaceae bacterium]